MRFTPDSILAIAQTCNVPTSDAVLDGLFENYDRSGSNRVDIPVYYRFLYRVAKTFPSLRMVELGFRNGAASLHFLKGGGRQSIGIDLGGKHKPELFDGLDFRPIDGSSTSPITARMAVEQPIDILFIDTDHSYETTKAEFEIWRPMVQPGGLILFDDIAAPEYGCGQFFYEIPGNKLELDFLHPDNWGFGVYFVP